VAALTADVERLIGAS